MQRAMRETPHGAWAIFDLRRHPTVVCLKLVSMSSSRRGWNKLQNRAIVIVALQNEEDVSHENTRNLEIWLVYLWEPPPQYTWCKQYLCGSVPLCVSEVGLIGRSLLWPLAVTGLSDITQMIIVVVALSSNGLVWRPRWFITATKWSH
jgi:hypothetical protein